ncbi:MAG: SpoIIE family protein phosphatase, partial [bacterium]|nr:SpoIIE family protein phosphatase [bacterium]
MTPIAEIFNLHNYEWSFWSLPPLIASIYFITLGLFVFFKNKGSRVNFAFFLLAFFCFIWLFSYAVAFSTRDYTVAYFWCKNAYFGINFIAVTMFYYIIVLLDLKKYKTWIRVFYLVMIAFFPVTRTKYFLGGVIQWPWGYYPYRTNIIYDLFILSFCLYYFTGLYQLYKAYKNESSSIRKTQLKFLFIAFFVITFAFVDFVAKYKLEVYPWGYIPVAIYLSILSYTIVRYRFMEIETVVHRTFLWILTILFLVLPLGLVYGFLIRSMFNRGFFPVAALVSVTLILFLIYYKKLKPGIDRFFRRRKYDYYEELSSLPSRIGGSLDINLFKEKLIRELKELLYIRNSLFLIKQTDSEDFEEIYSTGYNQTDQGLGLAKDEKLLLSCKEGVVIWIRQNLKVLEKEQIEVDPQFKDISGPALRFFNMAGLELLIPLTMGQQVIALLCLGKKENLQSYTIKDIELLENLGRQLGITVDNALHHKDIVDKERLAEEMRLGREIQRTLLPQRIPAIAGLSIIGFMQPAREIGGDYYDFIETSQEESEKKNVSLDIAIGDVAGKGVSAGLLMAMAKTAIYTISQEPISTRDILIQTNQVLNKHIIGDRFMTMLYLRWQAEKKRILYSGAGHESIIIYRSLEKRTDNSPAKDNVEVIPSGGIILGIIPDIREHIEEKEL